MSVLSTSLAVTVAHAVTYLTRPLATRFPADTLAKLHAALQAHLAAAFVASWVPAEPHAGAGRRVLSFAPDALPPRPVYRACLAAAVPWAAWAPLLAPAEFDLLVDPGCVAVRVPPPAHAHAWGAQPERHVVWSEARDARVPPARALQAPRPSKTLAQRLMEEDAAEDDALFEMLAEEMLAPTWQTPVVDAFPAASLSDAAPAKPARAALGHSRSSSRSSEASSSAFSFLSDESMSSCASLSSVATTASSASAPASSVASKQSRRERTRAARVFVDTSRTEVTPYDGGKTTVLTGGVMLGAAPAKNSHAAAAPGSQKPRRF
ncbi:hypothetical protein DFH11DRAFT_1685828 [Phellopilus nigrolimitatus]|nr:hypothetical protein DFH11DRAFT_1685828 [Phellopilus nigrolimitatus]